MRGLATIITFLFVGILTAFYIGFGLPDSSRIVAVDEELVGLNEKYTLKFSHVVAKNTPKGHAAAYFAELVKEKTDGWVEIQLFPNGVLYDAQEEFEALKKGDVHIIAPAFSEVTIHDRKWTALDLPYLFDNEIMVEQAFEGRIGELLLESFAKKGFMGIAFWDNGFKQLTNNVKPIIYPEDITGLSFRVMPSEALFKTYRILGARAVTYPFNDVYNVLRDGIVDGQENTLSNIYSKGFYQQQRYMTISNHNYLGYVVLVEPEFWSTLPERHQSSIQEAMDEVTMWLRKHAMELNNDMLQRISSTGITEIHEQSEEEKDQWRKVLKPLYDEYETIIGKELMDELKRLQIDKEL
ncbi:TRAP transporter substrate-binding protein [Anaerobacillus sp. CMMVII]|uniref:TRAP transporter substrate-binding protein n=1 Tax=Anaerobacillus sp. CMMVII TaxID=2755588 RepID=UPI0021B70AAF|nr:TRAP transporter substrate-binding protein [Anaerobacillus sp. CMMVII]MCT8138730.1 TRAP transporter substrate-binding protein [Anaerobacillus sp. CMMVII]